MLTYVEIKKMLRKNDTLIIPVGTIEAHGSHLPLGTDVLIPEYIANKIAEKLHALVAPPIYYGVTRSLLGFPGSFAISEETLERIIYEIILSAKRHGLRFFIVINGHGGNITAIRNAARKLWLEHEIPIAIVHWWIYASEITKEEFNQSPAHAGVDETAAILAINEKLVKKELYDESEVELIRNGLEIYPRVGSILIYEPNSGLPIFDVQKAKMWFDKVIEKISNDLASIKERILRKICVGKTPT